MTGQIPEQDSFTFEGVGLLQRREVEKDEQRTKTTVDLVAQTQSSLGVETNTIRITLYGSAAEAANGLELGKPVAVHGQILGDVNRPHEIGGLRALIPAANEPAGFHVVQGKRLVGTGIAPASDTAEKGFRFEARGTLLRDPKRFGYSEQFTQAVLQRPRETYLGSGSTYVEVQCGGDAADSLADMRKGRGAYVNGTIHGISRQNVTGEDVIDLYFNADTAIKVNSPQVRTEGPKKVASMSL